MARDSTATNLLDQPATLPTVEQEETEQTSRRMDPELRTIAGIIRQLEDHDEAAQRRMMAYLTSRYQQA